MTITNTFVSKLAVGFVAVAMLFSLGFAPAANAQSVSELQAQITALLAQITALQGQLGGGTTGTVSYTFTRDLTVGSTGEDVMQLQKFLNSKGHTVAVTGAGSAGMESSYFGSLTQAALAKYQASKGITPTAGYFGPITRAAVHADMAATPTTPTTPGGTTGLQGGAGSLEDADFISSINNEDVGEGQDDVDVLGLKLEADDGSDLRVTAVRVEFNLRAGETGSDDFDDYADEVTIWFDGKEVGSTRVRDMNDSSGVWSRTITLTGDAVIRRGDVENLVVAVSALNNIDSIDLNNNEWEVAVTSVRYVDAQGAVVTETGVGDLGAIRRFEFTTFASANNVELRVSESSDNPSAGTVEVDEDGGDEVPLLIGELRSKGSDIEITELTVVITPNGAVSVEEMVAEFILVIDGDDMATIDADDCVGGTDCGTNDTAATYVFEDFEFLLDEGDTVDFEIVAVLLEFGGDFTQGDSLTASVNSAGIEAEDEAGDDLTGSELKGSANGEEQSFRSDGIALKRGSISAQATNNVDPITASYGTFTMRVEVTAIGETMYVPETSERGASSTVGAAFELQDSNGNVAVADAGGVTHSWSRVSGGSFVPGGFVRINDGQTAVFELTVTLDPADSGQYRLQLLSVGFGEAPSVVGMTAENATPATDFRTGTVNILD